MKYVLAVGAPLALVLAAASAGDAGSVQSGPQAGKRIGGPFNPLNVTGPQAGSKTCQV
jgi:hypothetical protein